MRAAQRVAAAMALAVLLSCGTVCGEGAATIAYKPDVVGVDRLFMVALKIPADTPQIEVTCPDSVVLLDRTRLPATSELRKYYFRAIKPARTAEIRMRYAGGEAVISIEIWSFDDLRRLRTLKGVQLPRRWPLGEPLPELKQGQTVTSEAIKNRYRKREAPPAAASWLKLDDDQVWALQPDTTIPRWHWVNLQNGCPVHGREIYRKVAFYPWIKDTSFPYSWKIKCPVGGEEYPSNDFANGDMTSGDFPDDGIGGACEYDGEKYGFIAEICQAYCHNMLRVAPDCADGYLATGDPRYVHKALVAMCRVAVECAYLATMTQHRHRNNRGQVDRLGPAPLSEGPCLRHSGFMLYHLGLPADQLAEAYDKIWPAIEQDREIIPFLRRKGFNAETHEDVRRFIEENLFAVWMQGAIDGAAWANEPTAQRAVARVAEVLNYKRGSEFMDWLYDGAGHMRVFVTNTYFRDGSPYESTGGYNGHHVRSLGPIVDSVEHLRQLQPDAYPEEKYPSLSKSRRYHNVFDFSMNTVNIDRTYPRVGDDSTYGGYDFSFPHYRTLDKITWQNGGVDAFAHAYRMFQDPKFAWALVNHSGWRPSTEFPFIYEELEREAAKWRDDWNDRSCLQDGYGLAMLRSGRGVNKRALWMMYGHARSHTHDDVMHIGLDAYQSQILGQLGYPRNWGNWEKNWITHLVGRQIPFVQMSAANQLLVDAGPVHVTEAHATAFSDEVDEGTGYRVDEGNWQRRMLALVDVSEDQFYCLDLYRLVGGEQHWWSFHAQEGDVAIEGLQLTPQEQGTLAGPEVSYGDDEWLGKAGCSKSTYGWHGPMFGFAHLYNVQRGRSNGGWSVDWALKDAKGLHFRLTAVQAQATEAAICDGKSPAGGSPYEMKWVLLHHKQPPPTQTQITCAMEMYRDHPVIQSVRPLSLSGDDEAGFPAYGLVVQLADRTDTIFASANASVERRAPGGFEFAGRFGLYSERNGAPIHAVLIQGTKLTKNGAGITQPQAEHQSEIVRVDRQTDTVTVSPAPANPTAMVGTYVYLANRARRVAYKVLQAKKVPEGAELQLEFESLIGVGAVTGVEERKILTDTPFPLRGYRYYHGARIVNASGSVEYPLAGMSSGNFALIDNASQPAPDQRRLEREFPTGTRFRVYDYGVGDRLAWPIVAQMTRPN